MSSNKTVAIIGSGYVGLVTGAGLASLGHTLRLADIDEQRIMVLESGVVPIFEQDLESLFSKNADRITFTSDNVDAVDGAEFVFLCLPTPESENGSADLSAIQMVIEQITPHMADGSTLVVKSTVPPGSTKTIAGNVNKTRDDVSIVAHPEFLREGRAVRDFLAPDRLVFGGPADACKSVAELYYNVGDVPEVITDATSAEMIKYASNSYLAARLTYINTLAKVCEIVDADIVEVTRGMGFDNRIGPHFLRPGPGFGGSCFPKDTAALVAMTAEKGYRFSLLEAIIDADDETRRAIVDKVASAVGGTLKDTTVALWGIAFKANTDDTRESPALKLAAAIQQRGAAIVGHDPMATTDLFPMHPDPVEACRGADVLVVATEWPEYRSADLKLIAKVMRGDAVVDARNHLDSAQVADAGLRYSGVGRPELDTL